MLKIQNIRAFTLIELIIVVVLIGILAAVALPKFASLTGTAQASRNAGFKGAFAGGVGTAHGIWLANGSSGATDIIYSDSATTVDLHMNASGWPDGANGATSLNCAGVWNAIMQGSMANSGYTATTAGTVCTFTGTGVGNSFTYDSATGIVT